MDRTMNPLPQHRRELLQLLLLLLTMPAVILGQTMISTVVEGSGTTMAPTTVAPIDTNFQYPWGTGVGDRERIITGGYYELQFIFDIGTRLPFVVNDVAHPKLVLSSNGLIIDTPWFTSTSNPGCQGYTNRPGFFFLPQLVLAPLWTSYDHGIFRELRQYARITSYADYKENKDQYDRDFQITVDRQFAESKEDIAWVLVGTIFHENDIQKNYLQIVLVVLSDYTFRISVEYKSVNLPIFNNLFVGYCQNNYINRFTISDIFPSSSPVQGLHLDLFNTVLPNSVSTPEQVLMKQRFIKSARCLIWTHRQPRRTAFDIPPCPCTFFQAIAAPNFGTFTFGKIFFTVCAHGEEQVNGLRWKLTCCYNVFRLPFWLFPAESYSYLEENDLEIGLTCNDVGLFYLYSRVRPSPSCAFFRAATAGGMFGDPHFQTLDNTTYTCNAIGYYRFFMSNQTICDIKLDQIKTASVITGISCKDKDTATITFDLSTDGDFTINIKAGTSSAMTILDSMWDANGGYSLNGISILKDLNKTESYTVKFSAKNIGLSVMVVRISGTMPILRQILTVDPKVKALNPPSSGLLGTFNGNKEDDLRSPDGTIISINSTERQIYTEFCKKWERGIAGFDTIYEEPSGNLKEFNATFIPSFCDELTPSTDVITMCKGNKQCECDGAVTGSTAFASATLTAHAEIKTVTDTLANSPPTATGPLEIEVTVNMEFNATFTGVDPDNDTVTLSAPYLPPGATLVGSLLKWTPPSLDNSTRLSIKPTDSTGMNGTDLDVTIKACDCKQRGKCLFDELVDGYKSTDRYQVVMCSCDKGWLGNHCESDVDACCSACGHTCYNDTSCIDLDPGEEATLNRSFTCTACKAGYSVQGGICVDVDECAAGTSPCMANADCTNSPGNFTCACSNGFTLNGTDCVDIDECSLKTDNCNQTCTNNVPGFNCGCFPGYDYVPSLNACEQNITALMPCVGTNCDAATTVCIVESGMPKCRCLKGYELDASSNTTCQAINECTSKTEPDACRAPSSCMDLPNGYACVCPDGYLSTADQRGCKGCPTGKWGPACNGTCNCAVSNSTCIPDKGCLVCSKGLQGASCDQDVDECKTMPNICGDNSTCTNSVGSYTCKCNTKFQLNSTTFQCEPINMCMTNPCSMGTCVQLGITYRCDCQAGFGGDNCDQDNIVCPKMKDVCQNGGTCVELIGDNFECSCTSDYIGSDCSKPAPVLMTTTATPSGEFSGSIKLESPVPANRSSEEYKQFKANLTKALVQAISKKLGLNVAVEIDRINMDGQVLFTIIAPSSAKFTASDYLNAIADAASDGTLKTDGGTTFKVKKGSITIGGDGSDAPTTEANKVLPAVLGAVLGALFLALFTIFIAFVSKRLTQKAALQNAAMASYGYRRGVPGRLQWLPRAWISGRALAQVRPRMRPQNTPWAVDPFEPEVEPEDVNWQQWRGGDNSYYNRTAAVMAARARGMPGGVPNPLFPRHENMMFRSIPGPYQQSPSAPAPGLMRTRIPSFLRRTLRSIPAFFQRPRQPPTFAQGDIPGPPPHPGLPYVAPGSTLPVPMMMDNGGPPPPMRMRMSSRAAMPGSGMGSGNLSTMPPKPTQFSWGTSY